MSEVLDARATTSSRPPNRAARLPMLVAGAVLLAILGYLLGSHRAATRVVTGSAYVGDRVVSMTAPDGTVYGFSDGMPWIDANNSYHEGRWPDCLGSERSLPSVTFGISHVDYPTGSSVEQVVYVDCRA